MQHRLEAQSQLRGGDSREKSNEDDVKHSAPFQPPPCVLPTGGKGLGQEILSSIMQILRNSHLQLARPVYASFCADLQPYTGQNRDEAGFRVFVWSSICSWCGWNC